MLKQQTNFNLRAVSGHTGHENFRVFLLIQSLEINDMPGFKAVTILQNVFSLPVALEF